MNKKCIGCGITLQDNNILLDGYTTDITNDLCQRCFKLKNYGEYEETVRSNTQYINILKEVGKTKSLVLYVVDLLSIPYDLKQIRDFIPKSKIILALNKKDVLPFSIKDEKIIEYFQKLDLDFTDIILISAEKNYNLDHLMKTINANLTDKNVYVVGNTNAGKSTLINKIRKNYINEEESITISPMPSTTLSEIKVKINNFYLIDTPGLVNTGNILNYVTKDYIKKISPRKEIKPRTYQIKKGQSLVIEDFVRVDYIEGDKNSFTVYVSNDLKIKRINSSRHNDVKHLADKELDLMYREDIVINGLGFIKVMHPGKICLYCNKDIEIFKRRSLI